MIASGDAATMPSTYEPFDADYLRELERAVLSPISDTWFRPRLIGAERLPASGPALFIANHSGNAFPYDAIVLDALLWKHDGMDPARKIRTVFEKELALYWWMRPFGIDNLWRRGGGVDMTFDNLDRLLARGDRVLQFPEGVPGIGKGFHRRYRLQRFHKSFVLLAARYGIPVHPIHIVNAEWIHPFGYPIPALDRLAQRLFRVPFLPLPLGLVAAVLPWVWYLAFPAQLTFVAGEPIDVPALVRQEGIRDASVRSGQALAHPDVEALDRVAKRVRLLMQAQLDRCVAAYGDRPYDAPSLARALRSAGRNVISLTPLGWPARFLRFERDRARPPARGRLHALLRDLDVAGYYLPLGWALLAAARALRRPPYGVRGLSEEARRERTGEFVWRLAERPLPAGGEVIQESRSDPSVGAPRLPQDDIARASAASWP